jgi:hypothetical protein
VSDEPTRSTDAPIRVPAGIIEHWCEHPGCKKWGSLGFPRGKLTAWFCGEHKTDE